MTAWDVAPELSDGEIDALLEGASMMDAAGLAPGDVEWVPTYDLNAATAAGWMAKAGKAAATVEVDPPGSGIVTSKVFDNCRRMAQVYASRGAMAVEIK